MALYGADGAVLDGDAQRWEEGFLATRCLTIAGGTSEVQRNVIAERMLGQPRDAEPASLTGGGSLEPDAAVGCSVKPWHRLQGGCRCAACYGVFGGLPVILCEKANLS